MGTTAKPLPEAWTAPRWVRALWIAGLVVAAGCIAAIEVDAASLRYPHLARFVPQPFASYALERRTTEAIARKQGDEALSLASAWVLRDPVPGEPIANLAVAASLAQRYDLATRAYLVGQQRGWRAEAIQRYAALVAMEEGNLQVAGYRLAALWKSRVAPDTIRRETLTVLASPAARNGFAAMMAQGGSGMPDFVRWAPENLPDDMTRATFAALRRTGYRPDCTTIAERARALASGRPDAAAALWDSTCGNGGAIGAMAGGRLDFPEAGAGAGPFDWTYPSAPGLSVEPNAQGLAVTNTDMLAHVVAQRSMALKPGERTVQADVSGGLIAKVRVVCAGASTQVVELGRPAVLRISERCPRQRVDIEVAPGSGRIGPLTID